MPSVSFSKSQEKKIVKLFIQDRMSTPALDNLCKYKKSDQTKQELLRKIRSWNKEKGDPYQGLNIEVKYQYKYGRYRLVD